MPSVEYNSITFPSYEEYTMYLWLEEAKKHCIIESFEHQPPEYILSTAKSYKKLNTKLKTKIAYVDRELLKKHRYTADFKLVSNYALPFSKEFQNMGEIVVDTKGSFQQYDGARSFSINQKWMLEKFGIYVHQVIPQEFFQKTFVPERARYTPQQGKIKKCYIGTRLVREYFDLLEDQT